MIDKYIETFQFVIYLSVERRWGIGKEATHSWTVTGDLLRLGNFAGWNSYIEEYQWIFSGLKKIPGLRSGYGFW